MNYTNTPSTNADRIVVKSNHLIEASYSLSLSEQKMILSAISQVNSKEPLKPREWITIRPLDLHDLINSQNVYSDMRTTCDSLLQKLITVTSPEGNDLRFQWLSQAEYIKYSGEIRLQFHENVIPYISELSERFTQYRFDNVKHFKSTYAIRLYEMFLQWKDRGVYEISDEDLRKKLDIGDKYPNMTNFQTRVIKAGLAQINKHSDMKVKYSPIKSGKRITGFQFEYQFNKNQIKHPPKNTESLKHGAKQIEIIKSMLPDKTTD